LKRSLCGQGIATDPIDPFEAIRAFSVSVRKHTALSKLLQSFGHKRVSLPVEREAVKGFSMYRAVAFCSGNALMIVSCLHADTARVMVFVVFHGRVLAVCVFVTIDKNLEVVV
jgi:hypothetical protein